MYLKNDYMDWDDYLNADSDAIFSGQTDILLFGF